MPTFVVAKVETFPVCFTGVEPKKSIAVVGFNDCFGCSFVFLSTAPFLQDNR